MQEDGLKARVRKRHKVTTDSDHDQPMADNLLRHDFTADRPNQRWVGDTSELRIGENGKAYLAVILDLYARLVVGWAISAINDRHLTFKALEMALKPRRPGLGGCSIILTRGRRTRARTIKTSSPRTGSPTA